MSNRSASLSSQHYASKWKIAAEGELNDRAVVNRLAIDYATTPDGPDKEAKCLELVQCFHGYIMKYLNMIIRGHLPSLKTPAGKDASKMLCTLVPKGKKPTRESLGAVCRTLHLAFKQNTADDVYDTLVVCIMKAIRKYDPTYTIKVRGVCEAIDEKFPRVRIFTEANITGAIGINSLGCLRMLVRRGHLATVLGPKKKVVGYKRTKEWPPPKQFLESEPVGFVYFLPMYFRYYLHEYISSSMSALESKEGVLQLEHRSAPGNSHNRGDSNPEDPISGATPHAEGSFVDSHGNRWAADISMYNLPLDVSRLSEEWVKATPDKLFRNLTTQERHLLYLLYSKELKWPEVASVLGLSVPAARKLYSQIMFYLRNRATVQPRKSLL